MPYSLPVQILADHADPISKGQVPVSGTLEAVPSSCLSREKLRGGSIGLVMPTPSKRMAKRIPQTPGIFTSEDKGK